MRAEGRALAAEAIHTLKHPIAGLAHLRHAYPLPQLVLDASLLRLRCSLDFPYLGIINYVTALHHTDSYNLSNGFQGSWLFVGTN